MKPKLFYAAFHFVFVLMAFSTGIMAAVIAKIIGASELEQGIVLATVGISAPQLLTWLVERSA